MSPNCVTNYIKTYLVCLKFYVLSCVNNILCALSTNLQHNSRLLACLYAVYKTWTYRDTQKGFACWLNLLRMQKLKCTTMQICFTFHCVGFASLFFSFFNFIIIFFLKGKKSLKFNWFFLCIAQELSGFLLVQQSLTPLLFHFSIWLGANVVKVSRNF